MPNSDRMSGTGSHLKCIECGEKTPMGLAEKREIQIETMRKAPITGDRITTTVTRLHCPDCGSRLPTRSYS